MKLTSGRRSAQPEGSNATPTRSCSHRPERTHRRTIRCRRPGRRAIVRRTRGRRVCGAPVGGVGGGATGRRAVDRRPALRGLGTPRGHPDDYELGGYRRRPRGPGHREEELHGRGHLHRIGGHQPEPVPGCNHRHVPARGRLRSREPGLVLGQIKADGSVDLNPRGVPLAGRVAKNPEDACLGCHVFAPGEDYVFLHDHFAPLEPGTAAAPAEEFAGGRFRANAAIGTAQAGRP